jgi:hypothetical protein
LFQTTQYQKAIKIAKNVLVLVLTVFIFYKLIYAYHINSLFQRFELKQQIGSIYWLLVASFLLIFNWGIEALKWKLLIQKYEPIDYKTAIKAILSGVTLSIITPNQIGDFAGRVIHLEVLNKIKGSLVAVIGHTAQVIITLFFGLFSLSFFSEQLPGYWYLLPLGYGLIFLLILVYLNLSLVYSKINKLTWFVKFEQYVNVFGAYNRQELGLLLLLSFLRYTVFLTQYYLLLRFFKVDIDFFPALACIIATFCVQSVVPSFLLLEIGLRGATALMFFSLYSLNQEGILLAAYSLWIVNMLFPAILGMYFIYKVRS